MDKYRVRIISQTGKRIQLCSVNLWPLPPQKLRP